MVTACYVLEHGLGIAAIASVDDLVHHDGGGVVLVGGAVPAGARAAPHHHVHVPAVALSVQLQLLSVRENELQLFTIPSILY